MSVETGIHWVFNAVEIGRESVCVAHGYSGLIKKLEYQTVFLLISANSPRVSIRGCRRNVLVACDDATVVE